MPLGNSGSAHSAQSDVEGVLCRAKLCGAEGTELKMKEDALDIKYYIPQSELNFI